MKRKHWTHLLPEAGRTITAQGDKIIGIHQQISELHKQIQSLRLKENDIEAKAMLIVQADWTKGEIETARQLARIQEGDTLTTSI